MWWPLLPCVLVCALAGAAGAQGIGIPSPRWGLGLGNVPEFTGLRLNYRDNKVKRVTGVNLTLWEPRAQNGDSVITGLSSGFIPGGGRMRGIQIGIFGIVGHKSIAGVNVATLGMGAGGDVVGVNVAGLGMGAGGRLAGVNIAGLGLGSGTGLDGLSVAVLGLGTGGDVHGVSVGGLGVGAGGDAMGITIGGLGAGAGGRMIGLNVGGLGLGAGRRLAGVSFAGLGLGAGVSVDGLNIAGLAVGGATVRGLSISPGVVAGRRLVGVQIAGASVHVIKGGQLIGGAVSAVNYIKGAQTGIAIGVVNYAWSVRGLQLGLVNIVRDNPTPLKVLPVLNTSW